MAMNDEQHKTRKRNFWGEECFMCHCVKFTVQYEARPFNKFIRSFDEIMKFLKTEEVVERRIFPIFKRWIFQREEFSTTRFKYYLFVAELTHESISEDIFNLIYGYFGKGLGPNCVSVENYSEGWDCAKRARERVDGPWKWDDKITPKHPLTRKSKKATITIKKATTFKEKPPTFNTINTTYHLVVRCSFNAIWEISELTRTEGSPSKWGGINNFKVNFGESGFVSYGGIRSDQVASFVDVFLFHATSIGIGRDPKRWEYETSRKMNIDGTWTEWINGPEDVDRELMQGIRIDIKSTIIGFEGVRGLFDMRSSKDQN